ncbi:MULTISPECIES: ParA family protein [Salinisphaera]|uniref:ParA family protein n=1 Tax=Salinisphaera TaxID=180541 RepID=UPI00333E6C6C
MIRLSLPQRKGGVGKTTLVRILAEWFSRNHRVLIVDFDDQCSLSSLYLPMNRVSSGRHKRPPRNPDFNPADAAFSDWNGRSSSADIFYPDRVIYQYALEELPNGRLDLLPADSRELLSVREARDIKVRESIEGTIAKFFSDEMLSDEYDMVIFDTGPSESPLMRGVIKASTHTLIPVELEQQCVDGLDAVIGMVVEEQRERASDNPLELLGLQVNKYQKARSLHNGLLKQLKDSKGLAPHLNQTLIPNRTAYAERDVRGLLPRSVFALRPSDPARKIIEPWCIALEQRLFPENDNAA